MSDILRCAFALALAAGLSGCGKEKAATPSPVGDGAGKTKAPAKNPSQGQGQGQGQGKAGGSGIAAFFPLAVGNTWTYETEIDGASACMEGERKAEITRTHNVVDKEYFIQQGGVCLDSIVNYYRADGAKLEMLGRGTYLKMPKLDESWKWAPGKLTWTEQHKTFEVPAGTFSNCWTLEFDNPLGPNSKDVFCEGVGLVQSEGQGYVSKLTAKNF